MNTIIAWFARNSVAANLLMIFIILMGANGIVNRLPVEVFPQFAPDEVEIRVSYRGATPEQMEESVAIPLEPGTEGASSLAWRRASDPRPGLSSAGTPGDHRGRLGATTDHSREPEFRATAPQGTTPQRGRPERRRPVDSVVHVRPAGLAQGESGHQILNGPEPLGAHVVGVLGADVAAGFHQADDVVVVVHEHNFAGAAENSTRFVADDVDFCHRCDPFR